MSDGEGGFAKVWLCSLGDHPPLPRLGGVLGMTDGSNMVVVCWTALLRPGACVLRTGDESAHGPTRARRKSQSPLPARLRRSMRWPSFRDRGFDIVRCWETSRFSARSSYMRHHTGSAVSYCVVDIVRHHHTVVMLGSGSCDELHNPCAIHHKSNRRRG